MGYFSNGTEGEMYIDQYCSRCVHWADGDCPVWTAHIFWSYELCNAKDTPGKQMLDMLIPPDGVFNAQCAMFVAAPAVGDLFEQNEAA